MQPPQLGSLGRNDLFQDKEPKPSPLVFEISTTSKLRTSGAWNSISRNSGKLDFSRIILALLSVNMQRNTLLSDGEPMVQPISSNGYNSSNAFMNSSISPYSPMTSSLGDPSSNINASAYDSYYSSSSNGARYDEAQSVPNGSTDRSLSHDTSKARPTPNSLGWDRTQWAIKDFYDLVVPDKGTSLKEPILKLDARYPDASLTPRIVYLDKSA
jgi:hypothetical protein